MKYSIALFGLLLSLMTHAQAPDFWVMLSDKDNSPYSLDSPEEFLSQRAIDRRLAQGIALDERDLPVNPSYIQAITQIPGVEYRYASKWFNAVSLRCDSDLLGTVQALPFVTMIKSNTPLQPKPWGREAEPLAAGVQARLPQYGLSANQIMDLNGHLLHEAGYEGAGMVMAILDSGFDHVDSIASFEHLFDENRILSTRDFVDGDEEVYDEHFHGRAVLSTIAAIKPEQVYGTAVEASFHLLRTEDVASESRIEEWNWIAGAEYADSVGADVLNTSLGYTTFDTELEDYGYADMDGNTAWITRGADVAASRGMLVVNSAGNSGSNAWFYIGAPADGDSVLAIGAIDADSSHTSFSSHGPSFDGRVKPNVCAQGRMAIGVNEDDLVVPLNGTSFSSPIIAGLATSLWQAVPAASSMEVHRAIEMSAHLYTTPNDSLGYGIPDFGMALELLEDMTSSVDEVEEHGFLLYPNPARDRIDLVFPAGRNEGLDFLIIDMLGKAIEVSSTSVSEGVYRFDISSLEQGMYMLRSMDGKVGLSFIKE